MGTSNLPVRQVIEPLLKAAEVAQLLNISKTQAYRLMSDELTCVRFGGNTVRVRMADLEKYISQHVEGGG